jgi:hypothetical protein
MSRFVQLLALSSAPRPKVSRAVMPWDERAPQLKALSAIPRAMRRRLSYYRTDRALPRPPG